MGFYHRKGISDYDKIPKNEILTWEEVRDWMNQEFLEVPTVYAWTANKVITIYDDAMDPYFVPRHPVAIVPKMAGGKHKIIFQ